MMRIEADWLSTPEVSAVFDALEGAGHQGWFVGGCVRNTLMGEAVGDIDIATTAHPEMVIDASIAAGLHPVPTGQAHGTITVVSGGRPFEVTTLRKDVETDGRRAVVAFAASLLEDARRRDFTMNALYADRDGGITDPLGGLDDLSARRVRFIQDPDLRIREDYLRSLRFFRFYAWYGRAAEGPDAEALAAIAANLDGLDSLSRERVGAELTKLLSAPDPAPAVAAMRATGVLGRLLPGTDDRFLAPLVHLEQSLDLPPDPLRRMAALGLEDVQEALRLSRADAGHLVLLRQAMASGQGVVEMGYRYGAEIARDAELLRSAQTGQSVSAQVTKEAERGAAAVFPVRAAHLMPEYQGAALGQRLRVLEDRWIASGFSLSRAALLQS